MTRARPDWAYVSDDTGRHWYHLTNGQKKPNEDKSFRPPSRALFAIPSQDVVSIPQWVSSKDSAIINEVVALETERLGIRPNEGPGIASEWKTVELNGSRTLVQSVSIPWSLPELESMDDVFAKFVPQYALYAPPANAIVLWTEEENWIAGYSRGEHWVHVHALGNGSAGAITSEVQLTLLELSAKGILDSLEEIVVWGEFDVNLYQALDEGTGRKISFVPRPAPVGPTQDWNLLPHSVSESRESEAKKKRSTLIASIGILALAMIVGAAFLHLRVLEQSNDQLRSQIRNNRLAADAIQLSIDKWYALAPAVDPKRSPLDIFHEVSVLLPEKGFRLTSFEMQNSNTVIVRGEGATMANALKIKGAIEEAPGLTDYLWEIPPPTSKGGLVELIATGTYQFSGNEE